MSQRRIPPLDGVRALAILLVIMRHTLDRSLRGVEGINPFLQVVMGFGWFGVLLFFTLSGFLIGGMIYEEVREDRFSARTFYMRRVLRILPAAFFFLTVVYWSKLSFDKITLYNYLFITNYTWVSFADHYWSLNVEEHFYLIFPFLFALLYRVLSKRADRVLSAFACGIVFVWVLRAYVGVTQHPSFLFPGNISMASHWQVDYFLFGVAGAILRAEGWAPRKKWLSLVLLSTPVLFVFLAYVTAQMGASVTVGLTSAHMALLAPSFAMLSFLFVLCAATQEDAFTKVLSCRVFGWIGLLSYSMYIWHMVVIAWVGGHKGFLSGISDPNVYAAAVFAVNVAGTMSAAVLSYDFIERPFLALRRVLPVSRLAGGDG